MPTSKPKLIDGNLLVKRAAAQAAEVVPYWPAFMQEKTTLWEPIRPKVYNFRSFLSASKFSGSGCSSSSIAVAADCSMGSAEIHPTV